ncbi:unnamed protein product [Owenia fusiformis]|uniref:Dehydrogenase/reductase SDR family member 7 n=1 Tax=Owenia fusiformis TaxID=6347 RepID=A0A8S4P9H8_OWEFU|nr:unnamed protein product [Owenia fusiformis]
MDFGLCSLVEYAIIAIIIVQIYRLIKADGDLTLMWAEKFGSKPCALSGDVVWITGASSGIGEYLAYELAAAGCKLILSARRVDELERVKKQCIMGGPLREEDILVLPLDMREFSTHKDAVDIVLKHFNRIDVLVNNAGRSQRAQWDKIEIEVDRQMFELNVLGVVNLTRAVLPHMYEKKKGHIVVTSSVAGKLGAPMSGTYTGTKHAIQGYFEALRVEGAEHQIDITLVCPGPVFSELLQHCYTDSKDKEFGQDMDPSTENRMTTARCAELMAIAMANKLDEVWISTHPVLLFIYLFQYFPWFARKIGKRIGLKRLAKLREGRGGAK